jgi:hypothetical protein
MMGRWWRSVRGDGPGVEGAAVGREDVRAEATAVEIAAADGTKSVYVWCYQVRRWTYRASEPIEVHPH